MWGHIVEQHLFTRNSETILVLVVVYVNFQFLVYYYIKITLSSLEGTILSCQSRKVVVISKRKDSNNVANLNVYIDEKSIQTRWLPSFLCLK